MDLAPERSSSLYNKDLAPVPMEKRTWGIYNYASLWVAMSVCIPTYMLASGLIAGGMSWKQAIGTILLGNVIVLIPMILNAHAGAKFNITLGTRRFEHHEAIWGSGDCQVSVVLGDRSSVE